jgi:hypothetical protein
MDMWASIMKVTRSTALSHYNHTSAKKLNMRGQYLLDSPILFSDMINENWNEHLSQFDSSTEFYAHKFRRLHRQREAWSDAEELFGKILNAFYIPTAAHLMQTLKLRREPWYNIVQVCLIKDPILRKEEFGAMFNTTDENRFRGTRSPLTELNFHEGSSRRL